jgi:membrane protease YdiL (CAAX protease family)/CRP-like cAMP-binding protein
MDTNFWRNHPLFSTLSSEQLSEIMALSEEINLGAGEYLFHHGDHLKSLFLIKDGVVDLIKHDEDIDQPSICMATLTSGQSVGGSNILGDQICQNSARADVATTILKLDIAALKNYSQEASIDADIDKEYQELTDNVNQLGKQLEKRYEEINAQPTKFRAKILKKIAKGLSRDTCVDKEYHELTESVSHLGKQLAQRRAHGASIYTQILTNLGKETTERLRDTETTTMEALRQTVEEAESRVNMGKFVLLTIFALTIYEFTTGALTYWTTLVSNTIYITLPLELTVSTFCLYFMWKSGYPMQTFGLTTKNWQRSLLYTTLYTGIFIALLTAVKSLLIMFVGDTQPEILPPTLFPVIENGGELLPVAFLYLSASFVQELMIRGCLQSSLELLLTGRYRVWLAIIASNLIFSSFHLYLSPKIAIFVLIPGFFWGWLYHRQRNLIGVTLSHFLIGFYALSLMGLKPLLFN